MSEFEREVATEESDRPHAFQKAGGGQQCVVCQSGKADNRHTQWEQLTLASREQAQRSFSWEKGS